jgi:hypothetical protein
MLRYLRVGRVLRLPRFFRCLAFLHLLANLLRLPLQLVHVLAYTRAGRLVPLLKKLHKIFLE